MSGRKKHHEEEHENHERWLVSYADMITVLMALFIVLFAMSQVDAKKFNELASGLAEGFGNRSGVVPLPAGQGILHGNGYSPIQSKLPNKAAPRPVNLTGFDGKVEDEGEGLEQAMAQQAAAQQEYERLDQKKEEMERLLRDKGLEDKVEFRINERGLVAAVVADDILFDNGSSHLRSVGRDVISTIAPVLADVPDRLVAEGHANHLKMTANSSHASNMHLSGARAATVVQHLLSVAELDPKRVSASGYGDTRPLWPIDDPRAINGNRRVDLVMLSPESKAVRRILPQIAKVRAGQDTPAESSTPDNEHAGAENTPDPATAAGPETAQSAKDRGSQADTTSNDTPTPNT